MSAPVGHLEELEGSLLRCVEGLYGRCGTPEQQHRPDQRAERQQQEAAAIERVRR